MVAGDLVRGVDLLAIDILPIEGPVWTTSFSDLRTPCQEDGSKRSRSHVGGELDAHMRLPRHSLLDIDAKQAQDGHTANRIVENTAARTATCEFGLGLEDFASNRLQHPQRSSSSGVMFQSAKIT